MRVLSVDPGFERVGVAIIEKSRGERESLLFSSCIKTPSTALFSERLLLIGKVVEALIKKYKPDILAIESVFFSTNQKTAIRVSEASGAIILLSKKSGLRVYEYTPLQVKVAITGYGKATKNQVATMIPRLITVPEKRGRLDDEVDAIAIGLTHCSYSIPVEK